MILDRFVLEVRPTGGVHNMRAFGLVSEPVVLFGRGSCDVEAFAALAPSLAYGSAVVFYDIDPSGDLEKVEEIASRSDFREWHRGPNFPGLPAGTRTWIKSHYDGDTYGTHREYLLEAVRRTSGPVLELGCGDGSTPVLHDACTGAGRLLVTVDSDWEWLQKFEHMRCDLHLTQLKDDPADTGWLNGVEPEEWGVVFVDHSPGRSRRRAVERARKIAEYIVVHDTEELGYGLEDLLSSFKYRKDFRRSRPWTTVVSDRRSVW